MPLVTVLVLLLPPMLAAALLLRRHFEEAAPLVMLGLFLLLYLLGWAGALAAGPWLLWGLWAASVGYLGWALVKKRLYAAQITAGLGVFVLCAAALWWLCRGRRYMNWDEYSHWGRALKGVFHQNVLPAVATLKDEFKEYPPGVAPLQATVMKAAFTGYREDVAIWLQGLFSVSLLLYPLGRFAPLFGGEGEKAPRNPVGAVGAGLLLFLAPAMVFWNYYTETTVDGLLGVLFAFAVLVELLGKGEGFDHALQGMAMAALPLVKASGMMWAAMAFAVILACRLGRKGDATAGRTGRHLAGKIAGLLAPLLCALAGQASWSAFMALHDVPRRWSAASFSFGALWQLVAHGQPAWRAEVAGSYFQNIFADFNYGWPVGFLPYMGFFAVFVGVWALLRRAGKGEAAGFGRAFWAMMICGGVYLLGMLLSYLFVFSEYEAVRLASLSRYLNTYLAGMLVFLLGWLAAVLAQRGTKESLPQLLVAAALWLLCGNPAAVLGAFATAPAQAANSAAIQNQYTAAAEDIRQLAGESGQPWPVYVVAMDDLGITLLRLDYELAPEGWLPDHFSSIGPEYAEDDLMSKRLTADEWAALLQGEGYRYVYLLEPNEAFAAAFGSLFAGGEGAIAAGGMYRVAQAPGGVTLERI